MSRHEKTRCQDLDLKDNLREAVCYGKSILLLFRSNFFIAEILIHI